MKELPYFRFTCQEWQNGNITLESMATQGVFINVCCYYWVNNCNLTQKQLAKKFKNHAKILKELFINNLVGITNENICIKFLDEQWQELSEFRLKKQKAGSKGGKQKSSNARAELKHNSSYKDKDKDKDNTIPAKSRKQDPVWDSVCELFGLKPQTKSELSRVGKIVRDLKIKLDPDIEPLNQIKNKMRIYKDSFIGVILTPEALLKHWDFLESKPKQKQKSRSDALLYADKLEKDFIPLTKSEINDLKKKKEKILTNRSN